jgi:hypothetical protein
MKMTERIKRKMRPDKSMTLISLFLPDHVIEDLKKIARRSALAATRRTSGPTSRMDFVSTRPRGKRDGLVTAPSRV